MIKKNLLFLLLVSSSTAVMASNIAWQSLPASSSKTLSSWAPCSNNDVRIVLINKTAGLNLYINNAPPAPIIGGCVPYNYGHYSLSADSRTAPTPTHDGYGVGSVDFSTMSNQWQFSVGLGGKSQTPSPTLPASIVTLKYNYTSVDTKVDHWSHGFELKTTNKVPAEVMTIIFQDPIPIKPIIPISPNKSSY